MALRQQYKTVEMVINGTKIGWNGAREKHKIPKRNTNSDTASSLAQCAKWPVLKYRPGTYATPPPRGPHKSFYWQHYLSNKPHFLGVYWHDNPLGMLGEHEKSL